MKNNIVVILYTVPVMSAHALTLLCFLVVTIILKSSVYICLLDSNSGVRPMSLGTIHVEAPTTQRLIPGLSLGVSLSFLFLSLFGLNPAQARCNVQSPHRTSAFWYYSGVPTSRGLAVQ